MSETAAQRRARQMRESLRRQTTPPPPGATPEPGGQTDKADSRPPQAATEPRSGRGRTRAGAPPGSEKPKPRVGSLEYRLGEFFGAFALVFSVAGDEHCAMIITRGAEPMAEAWAKLANESPAVKRVLETLISGSAWGGVILTTASVAVPIAQHHNLLPANSPFGLRPPAAMSPEPPGDVPPQPAQPGPSPNGSDTSPVTPSRHNPNPASLG